MTIIVIVLVPQAWTYEPGGTGGTCPQLFRKFAYCVPFFSLHSALFAYDHSQYGMTVPLKACAPTFRMRPTSLTTSIFYMTMLQIMAK